MLFNYYKTKRICYILIAIRHLQILCSESRNLEYNAMLLVTNQTKYNVFEVSAGFVSLNSMWLMVKFVQLHFVKDWNQKVPGACEK